MANFFIKFKDGSYLRYRGVYDAAVSFPSKVVAHRFLVRHRLAGVIVREDKRLAHNREGYVPRVLVHLEVAPRVKS